MRICLISGIVLVLLAFAFLFAFIVFPVTPQLAHSPVSGRLLGFLAPLLIGLALTITGVRGLKKQRQVEQSTRYPGADINDILPHVKASVTNDDSVDLALTQLTNQLANEVTPDKIAAIQQRVHAIQNGKPDFAEKLKQLQEAHESRLINDEEFEHLWKSTLDDMK